MTYETLNRLHTATNIITVACGLAVTVLSKDWYALRIVLGATIVVVNVAILVLERHVQLVPTDSE